MGEPMEWARKAACRDADRELFFVAPGDNATAAKAWCAVCPVRQACLDHAVRNHEYGVWGGQTRNQRTLNASKQAS